MSESSEFRRSILIISEAIKRGNRESAVSDELQAHFQLFMHHIIDAYQDDDTHDAFPDLHPTAQNRLPYMKSPPQPATVQTTIDRLIGVAKHIEGFPDLVLTECCRPSDDVCDNNHDDPVNNEELRLNLQTLRRQIVHTDVLHDTADYLQAVRHYVTWLYNNRQVSAVLESERSVHHLVKRHLTRQQLGKLRDAYHVPYQRGKTDLNECRNNALIETLMLPRTPKRIQSLQLGDVADPDEYTGRLFLSVGGDNKTEYKLPILFNESAIEKWYRAHPGDAESPLFCRRPESSGSEPLSVDWIENILTEAKDRQDITATVTPTGLRQTQLVNFASYMTPQQLRYMGDFSRKGSTFRKYFEAARNDSEEVARLFTEDDGSYDSRAFRCVIPGCRGRATCGTEYCPDCNRKLITRGYNQMGLIMDPLADRLGIPEFRPASPEESIDDELRELGCPHTDGALHMLLNGYSVPYIGGV